MALGNEVGGGLGRACDVIAYYCVGIDADRSLSTKTIGRSLECSGRYLAFGGGQDQSIHAPPQKRLHQRRFTCSVIIQLAGRTARPWLVRTSATARWSCL